VPAAYQYTGQFTLGYPDYRDTGTGRMLTAEPGGSYGIAAVDGVMAVPPHDGRWLAPAAGFPPPPPPAVAAPPALPGEGEGE
jgi:hypothetical protein